MADAPAWARELVAVACAEHGSVAPRLSWRRRARPTSSGVTRRDDGRIGIVAGKDPIDQRLTLLHELAHWLTRSPRRRRGRTVHHGRAFYAAAFALHGAYGIPVDVALRGEAARYPSALRHARDLRLPGADLAWSTRRDELREQARARPPYRVVVPEHAVRLVRDGRWTRCSVCGVRVVGPTLARLRRRAGRHVLLGR